MRVLEDFPDLKIVKRDIERGLVEIELVDNVMENPCSVFFLERRNDMIIEEILETEPLPKKLTQIKLKILPTENSKFYYCLLGIETIIFNLLNRIHNKRILDDLKKCKTYFKIYYIKDEMYNIPILCLEFYFFKKLLNETIDHLNNTLRLEIFYFTGFIGEINVIEDITETKLSRILKLPLLIGQPEFKKEGVLKTYNFSEEQIVEMNNIHGITITQLQMEYVLNNSKLSIFDNIREQIKSSNLDLDKYSEDDLHDVIDEIFGKDDNVDYLPF